MGQTTFSLSPSFSCTKIFPSPTINHPSHRNSFLFTSRTQILTIHLQRSTKTITGMSSSSSSSSIPPLTNAKTDIQESVQDGERGIDGSLNGLPEMPAELLQQLVYESLVWSSLHGLIVGHKSVERSGTVPGVGLVHAPFALLPTSFPHDYWRQACDLVPIFSELVDRVSLDGTFLQESLSRSKKVDAFTSRLLDIHSKMLESNKKEEIRLGLHSSDYMLDSETNELLQVELNTISSSFAGLSCLVSQLHRAERIWFYTA